MIKPETHSVREQDLQPIHRAAGEIMRELHKGEGEITPERREEILAPLTPDQRRTFEAGEEYI